MGFRVLGLGFRVFCLGFRVKGLGFLSFLRVQVRESFEKFREVLGSLKYVALNPITLNPKSLQA